VGAPHPQIARPPADIANKRGGAGAARSLSLRPADLRVTPLVCAYLLASRPGSGEGDI